MVRPRLRVSAEGGFTAVEMLEAAVIVLVILLLGATLAGQASAVWHNAYHDTNAVHDARQGLARVAEELRRSSLAVLSVDTSGADADALTYQLPVGRSGSTVNWGAEETEGWRVRVAVEDGRLVRTVLDGEGAPQGQPQVLATQVDDAFEDAKGFSVAVNGRLVTAHVRTRARCRGRTWRKAAATTVWLRN